MKMRRLSFVTLLSASLLAVLPPAAQSEDGKGSDKKVGNRLKEVEQAIEAGKKNAYQLERQAESLQIDLQKAGLQRVALADSVQNLEVKVSELETEIGDLNIAESEKQELLAARRDQFSHVLLALQRLSRLPPETVIAYPAKASDLVRTAILLKSAVPQIEDQAGRLREDLIALAATRELIAKRKAELNHYGQDLRSKRRRMDDLIRKKTIARKITLAARQTESTRIKRLSREARNLRDLFRQLDKDRLRRLSEEKKEIEKQRSTDFTTTDRPAGDKKSEQLARLKPLSRKASSRPLKPLALAKGALRYPVVGQTIATYGEAVRRGFSREGITLKTLPGAQVIAPYDGKVVFAGRFRGYGKLLIIEHGERYHSLLAGMSRIDGILGQWLLSGEPVGIMQNDGNAGGNKKPLLYLELRRNGQPINPVPWLAVGKGKANG